MSEDVHARAARLIAQERVEGITGADRDWLDRHLEDCAPCGGLAQDTDWALRSLRSFSVAVPLTLASRTQFRIHMRAREIQERERRRWSLWISCGLSWALGAASAPHVWRGFEWLGHRSGLPSLVWQTGFVLWWALPALVAAAILLIENSGRTVRERE